MLHLSGDSASSPKALPKTTLKQVEFNCVSCSGGSHANKVANMHRYLTQKGVYNLDDASFDVASLPANENIESIASGLALAHRTYGGPRSKAAKKTAVLFIVQPHNVGHRYFKVSLLSDNLSSLTLQMSDRLNMRYGIEKSRCQPIGSTGAQTCLNTHI